VPRHRVENERTLAQAGSRIPGEQEGGARCEGQCQERPRPGWLWPAEGAGHDGEQQTTDDELTADVVQPAAECARNVGRNLCLHRLSRERADQDAAERGDAEPDRRCAQAVTPHDQRETRERGRPRCEAQADKRGSTGSCIFGDHALRKRDRRLDQVLDKERGGEDAEAHRRNSKRSSHQNASVALATPLSDERDGQTPGRARRLNRIAALGAIE